MNQSELQAITSNLLKAREKENVRSSWDWFSIVIWKLFYSLIEKQILEITS